MYMRDEDIAYEAAHHASGESVASVIAAYCPDDDIVTAADLPMDPNGLADRVWIVNPHDDDATQAAPAYNSVHVAVWDRTTDVLSACTVALPALSVTLSVLDPVDPPTPLPHDHSVRIALPPDIRRIEVPGATFSTAVPLGAAVYLIVRRELDAAVLRVDPYRSVPNAAYGLAMHHGLMVRWATGDPVTFQSASRPSEIVLISHPDAYLRIQPLLR